MPKAKKRFLLARSDIFIIFGLVILLSGASFTLGVLFGFGIAPQPTPQVAEHHASVEVSDETKHATKNPIHGSEHADEHAVTAPKSSLRTAYEESKKSALTEILLEGDFIQSPKSIADAQAFMNSDSQLQDSTRAPASVDAEKNAEDKILTDAKLKEAERLTAGPAPAVSNLFERKPSSVSKFSPISGSYTLQVGSYATQEEATAKVLLLSKAGFLESYTQSIETKSGEQWYRVGVGSFPSADWAKKTGEKLIKRSLVNDYLVREAK